MEPVQEKWIIKLAAAVKVRVNFETKEKAKKEALGEAFALIDRSKDAIKAGMTFSVTQDGKAVHSMTEDSEQIDEIETAEAGQGSGLSAAEMKRAGEAQKIVVDVQKKLEEKLKAAGLSDKEIQDTITDELYFPLVREKAMPDNVIQDRYSSTQQMLDATNNLYLEAIKDLAPEEGQDKFALAKKGIGIAAFVANGVTSMVGLDPSLAKHAETATAIIGLSELVLNTGVTVAEAISKDKLLSSAGDIVDNIGSILTQAVSLYNKDIGSAVGGAYTAVTKAGMIAKYLAESPPQIEAALDSFAAGLVAGISSAASVAAKQQNATLADDLKAAASAVGGAMKAAKNIKTIKEAIEKRDFNALVAAVSEMGKEAVAVSLTTRASVEGAGKGQAQQDQLQQEAQDLLTKIDACIDTGQLVIATGKAIYDAAKQGEIEGATETVVGNIGEALSAMLGAFAPADVAKTVSAAYKGVTSAGLVASYIAKGQEAKAITALGDGFAAAMELCNPDPNDKTFATVGKAMAMAFKAGAAVAEVREALKNDDVDSMIDILTKAGKDAAQGALDIESTVGKPTGKEKQIGDDIGTGLDTAGVAAKDLAKLKELMKDDKAKEKMKEQLGELQAAEAKEEIEREQKEFDRMLVLVDEGGEGAADTRSVEILIKQMQKDRLIMELVMKIGGAGLDIAAKYVPGLAIAGAAVKLAASIAAAANRAIALNKWLDNQKDGKAAASVYSTSISNFVNNQAEQFSYYTIKAALELVQLIGASISVSGLGAAVGEPMQKAAALAETTVDKAKEFYDEAMLEKAWKTTRLALDNRQNRKLGLIARKQNPTLAKYSIAWGAVEKKDAIAKSAMASCGLNATTLAQKDTNVSNVVKYLETMFPDDRQVKRGLPTPDGWQPSEVTLSAKCFTAGKLAAEKKANLAKQETGAVEGCFIAVAEAEEKVNAAKKEKKLTADLLNEYGAELKRLKAALQGYKPVLATGGGEHTAMKEFVSEIAALIEVEDKLLEGTRKELAGAGT